MTTATAQAFAAANDRLHGRRIAWTPIVLAQSAVFVALSAAAAIAEPLKPQLYPWLLAAAAAAMIAEAGTLLLIGGIWSVARHTFVQCMRAPATALTILVLAVSLPAMPWLMNGDGTLAGKIRTFFSYGTSITTLLLSLVTIFIACHMVSSDVAQKYVFITITKPVARWQYLLGRWLGLVGMNLVLLAAAVISIYAEAQYLRGGRELVGSDRREVETEVFAARAIVWPDPVSVEQRVKDRIERLRRDNIYDSAVEGFEMFTHGDVPAARQKLEADIRNQEMKAFNSAGPGASMSWTFSGVAVSGKETRGSGTADNVDRVKAGYLRVVADKSLVGRILEGSPVRVNGVLCRAEQVGPGFFVGRFFDNMKDRPEIACLSKGQPVEIVVDPIIQICYIPNVAGYNGDERRLASTWVVSNPATGDRSIEERLDPLARRNTLAVTARCVSGDGRVEAQFNNHTKASVNISPRDVSVLFAEGTFEWNFVRSGLLILLQLAFVAAAGVLAGSLASFPVASLVCLGIMPFCMVRSFLVDAVAQSGLATTTVLSGLAMRLMSVPLPDFANTWPSDQLVDGIYIPWTFLGQTAVLGIGVRCLAALALGCVLFRRRELARVQV